MNRLFLPLCIAYVALASGCSPAPEVSSSRLVQDMPVFISSQAHIQIPSEKNNNKKLCDKVTLTEGTLGHYSGKAFFVDGTQTDVTVEVEGHTAHWKSEANQRWPQMSNKAVMYGGGTTN